MTKIRTKVALAKSRSTGNDDNNISDQCLLMSARASCAPCDGDLVSNLLYLVNRCNREQGNQQVCVSLFVTLGSSLA